MDIGEVESGDESTGPSRPKEPTPPKKNKTASETYTKVRMREALANCLLTIETWQLSQLEHILKRPDSYIGSVETITQPMWTYDSETKRMVHREVKYVPGFFKIVDEILVNAADNKVRLGCTTLVHDLRH